MMTGFREFAQGLHRGEIESPSVKVTLQSSRSTLYLRFNSKDTVVEASYMGSIDIWMGSLCEIVKAKTLRELIHLNLDHWSEAFIHDQMFCDLKSEIDQQLLFSPLELLRAALDVYRGRDYLYQEASPLICRCFGVRENDVLNYIRSSNDPTPEGLSQATKAAMGCRSCLSQLTKWMSVYQPKTVSRFYKEKSRAQWLLEIDYLLKSFPLAIEWKMEVISFQGQEVIIEYDKDSTQFEEEKMSIKLQDFLAAGLDSELSFFLIRARHLSNA